MKRLQIIDEQLATISFLITKKLRDKPKIVGETNLGFAKHFIGRFHSICAIKSDDVYQDLAKIKADFNFSVYIEDHFLFEDTNKKVVFKFKGETLTCGK